MSTGCTYVYHDRAFSDEITLCLFQRMLRSFTAQKIVFGVNQGFDCFLYILKVYKELVRELHQKMSWNMESREKPSFSHRAHINSSRPQFLLLSLWFIPVDVLFSCWMPHLRAQEATTQLLAAHPFNWNQWWSAFDPMNYHPTLAPLQKKSF